MRSWQQDNNTAYPTVTGMTESLEIPLWLDYYQNDLTVVNADLIIETDNNMAVSENHYDNIENKNNHSFGILTKHVTADWNNKLEVTFYQVIKGNDDLINKVKNEGLTWNGRQYLSTID